MTQKRPLDYYLLWIVAVISLGLNVVIIVSLLNVRRQAAVAFGEAAQTVANLKSSTIEYVVPIDNEIPVAMDVPVKFTVTVPINQTIPIDTTVKVPIELPIVGQRVIDVPISTRIPVNLTVEVPIDKTLPVNMTVPVNLDVPIKIRIADTPLAQTLGDVELILIGLSEEMGAVVTKTP